MSANKNAHPELQLQVGATERRNEVSIMSKSILSQLIVDVIQGFVISAAIVSLLPLMLDLITGWQWLAINAACIAGCIAVEVIK